MNCKQGDLAIYVYGNGPNVGKIVTCLRYVGCPPPKIPGANVREKDCWEVSPAIEWFSWNISIGLRPYCSDAFLRPIRDSDKTDEIIERIGKPVKETT